MGSPGCSHPKREERQAGAIAPAKPEATGCQINTVPTQQARRSRSPGAVPSPPPPVASGVWPPATNVEAARSSQALSPSYIPAGPAQIHAHHRENLNETDTLSRCVLCLIERVVPSTFSFLDSS